MSDWSLGKERDVRFRATFEQAAIGLAHVDPEGRWLEANPELCEIVGYGHDELASLTFRDLTHPDDLDADLECIRRVLSESARAYSLQKRYVRKNGSPVWIDLTSSLVRDRFGRPKHFIKVVRCLPLRPPVLLQRSTPARGVPAVGDVESVANDLDHLLLVILSYAELATSGLPSTGRLAADLDEIQCAARRAHELSQCLVRLSRD